MLFVSLHLSVFIQFADVLKTGDKESKIGVDLSHTRRSPSRHHPIFDQATGGMKRNE